MNQYKYGTLLRVKLMDSLPIMEIIAKDIERDLARTMAWREMTSRLWNGPPEVLFVHRDGSTELWTQNGLST